MTWFDDAGQPIEQAIDPMAQAHIDGLAGAHDRRVLREALGHDDDRNDPEPVVVDSVEALVDLIEKQEAVEEWRNEMDRHVEELTSNVDRLIGLVEAALGPRVDVPTPVLHPLAAENQSQVRADAREMLTAPEPEIPGGIDLAYFNGTLPEITGPGTREPSNRSTYRGE